MTAAEFAAAALTWQGVKWLHQGRNRHGCDCVGLPIGILAEAGVRIRAPKNYGRLPMQLLVEQIDRWCTPVDEPDIGVLVAMSWLGTEQPGHLGILVSPPASVPRSGFYLVHAHAHARRVVLNNFAPPWTDLVCGYWRARAVNYG